MLTITPENIKAYQLEKVSSAFTISDMEVFLFPELMMALVLGNIMSPRIWKWKQDPWFRDVDKMTWSRKLQRLKQYIMDHYSFNLDLETWGLTSQEKELERFSTFVDKSFFAKSNALFGYEGDKYYFDLDIRRHFGLDKYDQNMIPYWKTETVEAMDAFRLKPGYKHGAGECVSLAALYAAALFIVLDVSLEDIFLMATPLHSQNFIALEEGVITNNRRLVTKAMWFNGTELTEKARRALVHERVTIVSHISGMIHIDGNEASIQPEAYERFRQQLSNYLSTGLTFELFINFLRVHSNYRRYFQFEYESEGHSYYIKAEQLFGYEHGSKHRIGDKTRKKLMEEIGNEEFDLQPYPDRTILNVLEKKLNGQSLTCDNQQLRKKFEKYLVHVPEKDELLNRLCRFIHVEPNLPKPEKIFKQSPKLVIHPGMERSEIISYLNNLRSENPTVDLAFYTHRQLDDKGWLPFMKACIERNPVAIDYFSGQSINQVIEVMETWPEESVYDEQGLATPDEVVNFKTGDGLEKAICFATIMKAREPQQVIKIESHDTDVMVEVGNRHYRFKTAKDYDVSLTV